MADRSLFQGWGLELNDDDFARAVAALSVLRATKHRDIEKLVDEIRRASGPDQPPIIVNPFPVAAEDPVQLRDAWMKARYASVERDGPRFMVMGVDPRHSFEFAELLSRPAVGAAACYIDHEIEDTNIVWNFPLRIGLLPEFRTKEARAIVDAVRWQHLIQIVELSATARECEILLLPGNMRAATAAVLASRVAVRADCILVAGARDDESLGLSRLIDVLRLSCHASALAIANVPREERVKWFNDVIRELSHDLPLDTALFRASTTRTPLIVASPRLIELSPLGRHIESFARHLEKVAGTIQLQTPYGGPMIRPAKEVADAFRHEQYTFDMESLGATDIATFKASLPPELRTAPLLAEEPRKDRHVVARTVDRGKEMTTLQRARTYQAFIRIGFPKEREAAPQEPLPVELLPPSMTGHDLTIVFCEIPQKEGGEVPQPLTRGLHLPLHEETEEVEFYFRTPEDADRYEARIIVLHQNRVLQTLSYGAALDGEDRITLEQELDVYPFDQLGGRERFDAAIVLNRAPLDMRPCIVVGAKAHYLPSIDEAQIKKISTLLEPVLLSPTLPKKLNDAKLTGLLLKLANHGHSLWRGLAIEQSGAALAKAACIQVVASKPGEFLPIEIFYPRDAPLQETICPHGDAALAGGAPARCNAANAVDEICPVEFWGLNRVIEHVAYADAKKFKAQGTRTPAPLFERAIFAVSKEVRAKDVAALAAALKKVTGAAEVSQAKSWKEWEKLVKDQTPSLLVLLPHVDTHQPTDMPGLEISGDIFPTSGIGERHVRKAGSSAQPVVLLLGCSTNRADIALQNAVEAFKIGHAGVVLGTISTILGRHAASFAITLLEALKAASEKGTKFGDVLLDVKRRRVGAGDPFALSLAAYGDSEIRI